MVTKYEHITHTLIFHFFIFLKKENYILCQNVHTKIFFPQQNAWQFILNLPIKTRKIQQNYHL